MIQDNFSLKPYFVYLTSCLIYFLIIGSLVFVNAKGAPELWLNGYCNPAFDLFFKYYTNVGDGWIFTVFNLLLLFVGFYETLLALISILLTTALVQYMKLSLFHNVSRPKGFFPLDTPIHYVEGVDVHLTNSFPSGHTSTAMCMGMILAFLIVRHIKSNQAFWLAIAFVACFLVGISRVYLMQHFFIDTLAGTFIGTTIPLILIVVFEKYLNLKTHSFWSRSLLRLSH